MEKLFITSDSELMSRSGQVVKVLRQLSEAECDIQEVGNMYHVEFEDGYKRDAFEDELFDIHICEVCGKTMIPSATTIKGIECDCYRCECGNEIVTDNEFKRIEEIFD